MHPRPLKIGTLVRLTALKIWFSLATAHPAAALVGQAYVDVSGVGALPG